MAQTFETFNEDPGGDSVKTGLLFQRNRTDTLRSQFSGTSFPSTPVLGQSCYRTDQTQLYVCTDAVTPTWTPIAMGNPLGVSVGGTGATTASGARTNLGLGTAAVVNTGTGGSDVPTTTQADARYLRVSNNLSDVVAATARTNLGLGTAATVATGTSGATIPLLDGNNTHSGSFTATGKVLFPDKSELTIATGAVTITGVNHTLDTESNAASDDLDTISGGADGAIAIFSIEDDARNVVIKHNTGNILCPNSSDITLDTTKETITLIYSSVLSKWLVVAVGKSAAGGILHLQDQKSAGTDGGAATSGSWQTRTLNTEVTDTIGSTLSSNQFTLPAGTYKVLASAPAFSCSQHQIRLQNITDTTTTKLGTSECTNPGAGDGVSRSEIRGVFTITGTKTFELQHRVASSKAANGYGIATTWGTEIYADILIERIA